MKTPNIIDDYQDIVAEYNAEKREIMNYCNANDNKEHIIKILDWLYEECVSSGGDGDALWYSRYYDVKDIFPILQEFNNSLVFAFKDLKLNGNTILWGHDQECVTITNNKDLLNSSPDWIQAKLIW